MQFSVSLPNTATVADVKSRLEVQTGVLAKRQKIMGMMFNVRACGFTVRSWCRL